MSPLTDHSKRTGIISIYFRISKIGLTSCRQNGNDFSGIFCSTRLERYMGRNDEWKSSSLELKGICHQFKCDWAFMQLVFQFELCDSLSATLTVECVMVCESMESLLDLLANLPGCSSDKSSSKQIAYSKRKRKYHFKLYLPLFQSLKT